MTEGRTVGIPQPFQLPGYTCHCPDVQYRLGKTFGEATHTAMCDPRVAHADKLALSRSLVDDLGEDYGIERRLARAAMRMQLGHEVMLLSGARRPRNINDRMAMDCPPMPLREVTLECQGYRRPLL